MTTLQIAVDEIDDKSKEYILQAGGRVELVTTYVAPAKDTADWDRFMADARKAMNTTLVRLPEKASISEGIHRGEIDITFTLPGTGIEVTLTYGVSLRNLHTELTYDDETDYGVDEETQG